MALNTSSVSISCKFLSTSEAAAWLGLSRRTLEGLRCRGGGPSFRKLGRSVRYTLEDLQAWADAGHRQSTSDPGQTAGRPPATERGKPAQPASCQEGSTKRKVLKVREPLGD